MGNPIILRRRVQRDFTVLPNDVVRDPRLSWKALGLLVFMLSLPDDFRLHLKYLANQKPTGRDGTRAGLKELEKAGYLTIRHERSSGKFAQVVWEVTDSPVAAMEIESSPCSEKPNTVNPNTVFPNSEKPTLIRTKRKKELSRQRTTTTTDPARGQDSQTPEFDDASANLAWPAILTGEQRESAVKILLECPLVLRQAVLNEVGGLADRGEVSRPLGLLSRLVDRAKRNRFVPSAALEFQRRNCRKADEPQLVLTPKDSAREPVSMEAQERARKQLEKLRQGLKGR